MFLLVHSFVHAQSIRWNLSGFTFGKTANFYTGLGYDHNLNHRIGLLLDVNLGVSLRNQNSENFKYAENGNEYQSYYDIQEYWWEIAYQSKYFFSDNDERSFYVASGIAYRPYKFEIEINTYNLSSNGPAKYETYKKTIVMLPLSLRLGLRGSISGFFGDISFGMTYLPGAESKKLNLTYVDEVFVPIENSLVFGMNLALGIGWKR